VIEETLLTALCIEACQFKQRDCHKISAHVVWRGVTKIVWRY